MYSEELAKMFEKNIKFINISKQGKVSDLSHYKAYKKLKKLKAFTNICMMWLAAENVKIAAEVEKISNCLVLKINENTTIRYTNIILNRLLDKELLDQIKNTVNCITKVQLRMV